MLRGLATPVTDAAKRKTKAPIRWEFDEQSGKISFFGNGPIPDYTEHNLPSWDALKKDIRVIALQLQNHKQYLMLGILWVLIYRL